MRFQRFLAALVWCWAGALFVVAVVLFVAKFTNRAVPGETWMLFAIAGACGLALAAVIAALSGPSKLAAAVADLRLRVSVGGI